MDKIDLTKVSPLVYSLLHQDESNMKGSIETKEKCPVCKKKFKHIKKLGYICPECKTTPRRFYIYLHHQGKRYRIYSTPQGTALDSYQIAQSILLRINEEIKNHTFDPSKYIKSELKKFFVSNLISEYFERKKPTIAPSYLHTFLKHIETIKTFFNTKDVREIRKIDLENFKTYLENLKLSSKTVKNYLDTFKAFLNHCKSTLEIIPSLPSFPVIQKTQPQIKCTDTETQRWILENTPAPDRPIITFLMLSGCRPAEARALKVKDIDLKNNYITISASFSRNTLRPKRKGKNAPSVIIPIHPELKPILELCMKDKTPDAFVFTNPRTLKPYSQDALVRLWNKIRKNLNLPKNLRLYDVTRHSFATNLLKKGVNISKISKLLGHTNITTTQKYTHLEIVDLFQDIAKISLFQKHRERKRKKNT